MVVGATKMWRYGPMRWRANAAVTMLCVMACISVVMVWFTYLETQLLVDIEAGLEVMDAELVASVLRRVMVGFLYSCVNVVTGLTFLFWQWRAYRNLWALCGRQPEFDSGLVMVCWFVPLVNLVVLYLRMKELYEGSLPSGEDGATFGVMQWMGNWCLGLWWGLFAVGAVLGWLLVWFWYWPNGVDTETWVVLNRVLMISEVASAVSALLAVLLVRAITSSQELRAKERELV